MTGPRVAVIVLILISVIFFVGIGASLTREDDDPPPKDSGSAARVLDQTPDFLRSLLRLPGGTPKVQPADLLDLNSATIIAAPGIPVVSRLGPSEDKYRTARFRLAENSAPSAALKILYETDCVPEGMDSDTDLGKQETDDLIPTSIEESERCGSKDKACANLTIFKCGGMITFTCMGTGGCEVQLQD